MDYREQFKNQCIKLDFGSEVPYAFDYLPINARLNAEMYKRAAERAAAYGQETMGETK